MMGYQTGDNEVPGRGRVTTLTSQQSKILHLLIFTLFRQTRKKAFQTGKSPRTFWKTLNYPHQQLSDKRVTQITVIMIDYILLFIRVSLFVILINTNVSLTKILHVPFKRTSLSTVP